jgi:hypothetical protein
MSSQIYNLFFWISMGLIQVNLNNMQYSVRENPNAVLFLENENLFQVISKIPWHSSESASGRGEGAWKIPGLRGSCAVDACHML